jgi:hypothetical protein
MFLKYKKILISKKFIEFINTMINYLKTYIIIIIIGEFKKFTPFFWVKFTPFLRVSDYNMQIKFECVCPHPSDV